MILLIKLFLHYCLFTSAQIGLFNIPNFNANLIFILVAVTIFLTRELMMLVHHWFAMLCSLEYL